MEATETAVVCTKCGANLDTEGYPKWCKSCRSKYRREYDATKETMIEQQAFARGARAMQSQLMVEAFKAHPGGFVVWGQVQSWIASQPTPAYSDQAKATESVAPVGT
jgi:hypothetical protein